MPVWQALRWLSHLPCPSFIVFLWFWSTFFTMGVAFVEQFANPFLGLHKILILLLFWVPLLSRAQDILFTSRGLFFFEGIATFLCIGSAVPRLTRMNNVLSLPCRGSVYKHSSQVHLRDKVSELLSLCANTTKYWPSIFKLTQILNNFMISQLDFTWEPSVDKCLWEPNIYYKEF